MIVLRLLAMFVSYAAACVAAAAAALLQIFLAAVFSRSSDDIGAGLVEFLSILGPAILFVGFFGAIPFLAAIGLLHAMRRTSWLAHVIAGAAVSLLAFFVFMPGLPDAATLLELWYLPPAGAIGGLAYWLTRYRLLPGMSF